jgi:opacity protein-like surface antigen
MNAMPGMRDDKEMTMLRTLTLAALVSAALATGTSHAQALPTAKAPGAYIAVGGTYSAFEAQYPQRKLGGASAYMDLNFRRQIGLEGEVRWLRQNEINGSHETTYLVGPRLQIQRGPFSPYVKALAGDGNLQFPYGYGYGNYLVIAGGGGIDVSITDRIKLRLIDFEYQDWPKFSFGAITPYGVSAGVSYRFFNGSSRHPFR